MKNRQKTNTSISRIKRHFSPRLIILTIIAISLFSCKKETELVKTHSIINAEDQISKSLVDDPLFKTFDKANYELSQDIVNYSGEVIDHIKNDELNKDAKNRKFKSFEELALAKEKVGYSDYYTRTKTRLFAIKTKNDLFNKFPELKTISTRAFFDFYYNNRSYSLTTKDYNAQLEILKAKRKHNAIQ